MSLGTRERCRFKDGITTFFRGITSKVQLYRRFSSRIRIVKNPLIDIDATPEKLSLNLKLFYSYLMNTLKITDLQYLFSASQSIVIWSLLCPMRSFGHAFFERGARNFSRTYVEQLRVKFYPKIFASKGVQTCDPSSSKGSCFCLRRPLPSVFVDNPISQPFSRRRRMSQIKTPACLHNLCL